MGSAGCGFVRRQRNGRAENQRGRGKYEFTSSGMSDVNTAYGTVPNKHCVGDALVDLNFGLVEVDWEEGNVLLGACKFGG